METVDRLQRRIEGLQELQTIVSTMKALSAVSIRQYERAVASLADYYRTVELGLHVVLNRAQEAPHIRAGADEEKRLGAVVFGSDHGLCGRLNEVIVEQAIQRMGAQAVPPARQTLLAVGDRVAAGLEQRGLAVEDHLFMPGSAAGITETVQQILLKVEAWRDHGNIHTVFLFYNHHQRNGYQPTGLRLLPIDLKHFRRLEAAPWPSRRLPTFTMGVERLLEDLLHQYFFISIFRACAESLASEHASRLAAMQSAEKNLDDRLDEVMMEFRRQRQEAITMELLDVVSGFEAITSQTEDAADYPS